MIFEGCTAAWESLNSSSVPQNFVKPVGSSTEGSYSSPEAIPGQIPYNSDQQGDDELSNKISKESDDGCVDKRSFLVELNEGLISQAY